MVANKAKGIRAATAWNEKSAKSARNDDDANILCLPSDFISLDEAKNMAHIFLNTPFAGEERFVRRVNKVKDIEKL
jgi:ribose 5-phosphate isomerase B